MGSIGPLLVTVCTNQNRYSDPHLRSAATLALAKFMLVRYVPGHMYTKNLYSCILRNEIIFIFSKKKITLYKKGLQAFQIFKFINTLYLSMTIVCILSKVSLTTNNQVWSFAIQKYPFLSVAVCLFSSSEFCESNLQLLFTVLEKSPYPTIRANTIIALGDLTVRFPNLIEPWTPHMYARSVSNCLLHNHVICSTQCSVTC